MAICLTLLLPAGVSAAETANDDPQAVADLVNAVAPPVDADRTTPIPDGPGLVAYGDGGLAVDLPEDGSGSVALDGGPGDPRPPLVVDLPGAARSAGPEVAADGTVVYESGLGAPDVAVQTFDSGIRVQTVLHDDAAQRRHEYAVVVPPGGRIDRTEDGGLLVLDASSVPLGGFGAPWAKDATGADVPTHYQVTGDVVTQVVEVGSTATYPVVADPWLWVDLVQSARWVQRPDGWTLEVTPTGWARANAGGYAVGAAGWSELYAKYRNVGRGIRYNLDGMRDQWICHQQIVAIRAPRKPTWNLDEWRPNYSYAQTVNASCNPGGARWFD